MLKISPFAPKENKIPHLIKGIKLSVASAGLKKSGKDDIMLITMPKDTKVAGVFTQSSTASAPVDWCRKILTNKTASALLVHAGNANAFTGTLGYQIVVELAEEVANLLGCKEEEIYIAATGIIGRLPVKEKIFSQLENLVSRGDENNWLIAAKAIMTTDTFAKIASTSVNIDGKVVNITGIAKGSGMIMPNMATLLTFIFTDLDIPQELLQELLIKATDQSFNCITVDSDTSTSDTALLFSTGEVKIKQSPFKSLNDEVLAPFVSAFKEIMHELALSVIKDAEGISKFVTVEVTGAESKQSAKKIALSIANSPLVKTALAGNDANWGRIIMAVGKSGEAVDKHKLSISIGKYDLAVAGNPTQINYDHINEYIKGREILIKVDVAVGQESQIIWTNDLTHDYITINSDYSS
jgi:glutamate N-acetyltransferase/amino-acid N-acetyltransferase